MSDNFWNRWEWLPLMLGPIIGLALAAAAVLLCVNAAIWFVSWLFRRVD